MNTSQQYPVFMRKYEGRVFTGVIRHENCLLNTGNTTSPGIAISSHLAQELGLDIMPWIGHSKCEWKFVFNPGYRSSGIVDDII